MICCIFCKSDKIYKNLLSLASHRRWCVPYRELNKMGAPPIGNIAGKNGLENMSVAEKQVAMKRCHTAASIALSKRWKDQSYIDKQRANGLANANLLREAQKLSALARSDGSDRFVYVIKMNDRVVKVGSTKSLTRINRFCFYSVCESPIIFCEKYECAASFKIERYILDNSILSNMIGDIHISEGYSELRNIDSVIPLLLTISTKINSDWTGLVKVSDC